jgi:hypothetical protein
MSPRRISVTPDMDTGDCEYVRMQIAALQANRDALAATLRALVGLLSVNDGSRRDMEDCAALCADARALLAKVRP